ncbi:MAG: tRNA (adenosine(37)-N6)-dimethylallyltransferase MiaA [Deltaproteobacteria bacterium]|nr:tRNA (adenosine(37)-N6)-dimethylallyltransferase MiaA [Deltaproteobacteria bacterium]
MAESIHPVRGKIPPDKILVVAGPTASGKSQLALTLALELGGEIINADAMQVYRGLDIGTAKPGPEDRARVPHHLLDVADPWAPYNAKQYAEDAGAVLGRLLAAGRVPILCGGTGLYLSALLGGLSPVPPTEDRVRQAVAEEIARRGLPWAWQELARLDPPAANRLHPSDAQRIHRALEVIRATGQRFSELQALPRQGGRPEPVLWLGLDWPRAELHRRIHARTLAMLRGGWVEETRRVLAAGTSPQAKSLQAIGYRQIVAWLAAGAPGDPMDLAESIALRTRQYAKRQMTWFRGVEGFAWGPPQGEKDLLETARRFVEG